jgi:hypothetical protein
MEEKCAPTIRIGDNRLTATLVLPEGFDRSSLTQQLCESLLAEAGIDASIIDLDAIMGCMTEALAAPDGPFESVLVEAVPAVHGVDASIEWLLDESDDEKDQEAEEAADHDDPSQETETAICHYQRSNFLVVKAGDVLAKLHPEVPGTEGKDVCGKIIATRTAKPLDFKYDETLAVDASNHLIAQIDGVLMKDRTSARISDTLEIDENVDFNTGNVDFPGHVIVKRSVKDCFTVQARYNIETRGLVEAATLIAGRDLCVKGGFAGREQGRAEVQGDVSGKYLDAVVSHIGGDLCIDREVINCDTTVLGNIACPRGSIIGGVTRVSGRVELAELGATANPMTDLHVGVLPLLDPLIESLSAFVAARIEERDKLLSEQETITANSGSRIAPSHQKKLDEITRAMGALQLQLDRAEPSLERAVERADSSRTIDVTIHKTLHPNAVLHYGSYHYRITETISGPLRITVNTRGQLEFSQNDSPRKLLSKASELRTAA